MKLRELQLMLLLTVVWLGQSYAENFDGVPEEKDFLKDAYLDAVEHFPEHITTPIDELHFSVYQGFSVDLDKDGVDEMIVAGDISGESIYVVMGYYWENNRWHCRILNRSLGGGIHDFRIIDVNNDGRSEIFSVLQDSQYKQYCKIYRFVPQNSDKFESLFVYQTEGGFVSSCNFLLLKAKNNDIYKLRVDEVIYAADEEGGDIIQRTYVYTLNNNTFVLESRSDSNDPIRRN
ncbi:hypothetical protein K1X84_15695 [bacterium]|nr:hypothetical protein [bacterium]